MTELHSFSGDEALEPNKVIPPAGEATGTSLNQETEASVGDPPKKAEALMEVEYEQTLNDAFEYNMYFYYGSPKAKQEFFKSLIIGSILYYGFIIAAFALIPLIINGRFIPVHLSWEVSFLLPLVLIVVICALQHAIIRNSIIKQHQKTPLQNNFKKIALFENNLTVSLTFQEIESSHEWNGITEIIKTKNLIIIFVGGSHGFLVPLRVFPDKQKAEEFYTLCIKQMQKAKLQNDTMTNKHELGTEGDAEVLAELNYKLTENDYMSLCLYDYYFRPSSRKKCYQDIVAELIVVYLICLIVTQYIPFLMHRPPMPLGWAVTLLLLVTDSVFHLLRRLEDFKRLSHSQDIRRLEKSKLEKVLATNETLVHYMGDEATTYQWSTLVEVNKTKKHIFIYTGPKVAIIIPLRIFANIANAEAFYTLCVEKIKSAKKPLSNSSA
jgi:hypothetical protein